MSTKSAEKIAADAMYIEMDEAACVTCGRTEPVSRFVKAARIVSALRSAGFIRDTLDQQRINEWANRSLDAVQQTRELGEANVSLVAQVARLTRERDDALGSVQRWSGEVARIAQLERDLAGKKEDAAAWHLSYIGMVQERDALRATQMTPAVQRVVDAILTYKREAPNAFNLADHHERPWRGVVEAAHALTPQPVRARYWVGDIEDTAVMDRQYVIFRCTSNRDALNAVAALNRAAK